MGMDDEISPKKEEISIKKNLLRPNEAAEILNVSVYTIYRMLKRGQLNGTKIGGRIRVYSSSIKSFISNNEI